VFGLPFTSSIHVVKDVASTCAITGYQPGRQKLIIHPTNQRMRDFKVSGHVIFKKLSLALVSVDIIGHIINSTNGVCCLSPGV